MPLKDKIEYSIDLIRKSEKLALSMSDDGFHLAFSGGKDSQVLYHLTQMAGVKFKAHFNLTTLDPPQLLRFIRKQYPDVIWHRPEMNFFQLIKHKKMLPVRFARYCCQYLKEQSVTGITALTGVRREESPRRKLRNEVEISRHKFSGNLDQFNRYKETEHQCIGGKDQLMIMPILNWTKRDVWEFIRSNHLPYCELYDQGYDRIGCIFCPMASVKSKIRDRKAFPGVEKAIKRSIQYLIDNHNYMNNYQATADETFDWWCSNQSTKEFFHSLRNQTKLDF